MHDLFVYYSRAQRVCLGCSCNWIHVFPAVETVSMDRLYDLSSAHLLENLPATKAHIEFPPLAEDSDA